MSGKKEETEKRKVVQGVYRVGDMYYCAQCNTVLNFGEACPDCRTEFDWDTIRLGLQK